jgi:hypothetical protein
MARKQIAALAALVLVSSPCAASDILQLSLPGVVFYVSMPLDARTVKKEGPAFGMSMRGHREYQVVNVDTRMLNNFALGGIEAKWIIAGVVAVGATVALASKDKSTTSAYQQQQVQQAQVQQQQQQGGGGGSGDCPKPDPQPRCP